MWQMKEWLLKFVVHVVWKRRNWLYYAVSVVSIAGNLIALVGPSVQASIVLRTGALQAACRSVLPQVADVVLHRSVLYILLNLIVVIIVVNSGILGQTPRLPTKPDEFCSPSSSCTVVRGLPWPADNSYTVHGTQSALGVPMVTDTSKWLQQAHGDDQDSANMAIVCAQNSAMAVVCAQTPAQQRPSINKPCNDEQPKCAPSPSLFTIEPLDELVQTTEGYTLNDDQVVCAQTPAQQPPSINKPCNDEQPKCAPAPSLFTIEPLDELVQTTEGDTLNDDQAHIDKTLKHPLRKVASRWADLYRSTETVAGTNKNSMKAELPQKKIEQSMQLIVAAKKDVEGDEEENGEGEHEDNRLSRQEFNERVDSFIYKFKKSLKMQRQDSINRLLGLVGGGGDIRLIK